MVTEVSFIIVDFRAHKQAESLRRSLEKAPNSEVIIVDNTDSGRGYGEGCNIGAQQAQGDFLVFLNPDIKTSVKDTQRLIAVLKDQPSVGIVGPQIRRPNGEIEISCAAFPTPAIALVEYSFLQRWPVLNWLSHAYRLFGFDHQSSRPVPLVGGSCLALRKSDFERLNGFDENIFLYYEEFDLAYRMHHQLHKTAYFCAESKITHFGQASTSQLPTASAHFKDSRRYWFAKAFGVPGALVVRMLEFMEKHHG